jgi:hypothetical protein
MAIGQHKTLLMKIVYLCEYHKNKRPGLYTEPFEESPSPEN